MTDPSDPYGFPVEDHLWLYALIRSMLNSDPVAGEALIGAWHERSADRQLALMVRCAVLFGRGIQDMAAMSELSTDEVLDMLVRRTLAHDPGGD